MNAKILFIISASTVTLYALVKKRLENKGRIENADHSEEKNKSWDKVDEAAWESFPASDPPATW